MINFTVYVRLDMEIMHELHSVGAAFVVHEILQILTMGKAIEPYRRKLAACVLNSFFIRSGERAFRDYRNQ